MESAVAIIIGLLFATGIFSLLRRSIVKIVIGLMLISQATNLLVFTSGGLTRGKPAFAGPDENLAGLATISDPLPQALVLTAIVIGFGISAFSLVLVKRTYEVADDDDLDKLQCMED